MKKIYDGCLDQGRYISPGQCCYSIGLHNPLIIVCVQFYFTLINRVNLVLLILKRCLLPVYCFTIKQADLMIIKRKAFRNHTLLCVFAALFFSFYVYLSIAYILALKGRNSVMIFPPSSSFIRPITFLFFPMGCGQFSSFYYPRMSNLFSTSFEMSL